MVLPLVGREELVRNLKNLLYKSKEDHENVITVTGESGVGKTKLVRTLYDRRQTLSHFDIYEWVSFGPNLSASDVLNVVHRHQGPNQITVLFIKALLGNFESSVKMMKSGTKVFSDLASPLDR